MATDRDPSPAEARETLAQLSADAGAVRYPPLPRWFFAVQSLLVAGFFLAQLLPPDDAPKASIALALCAVVLGARYWIYRDDVSGVTPSLRDMRWYLAGILGVTLACVVVDATTDARWVWAVGAVVVATIVLWTGRTYVATYGRA
ncbi:hypothetical protein [Blastococcus sp. CCUG 61487]|uniref:hypothetical protein n=1 Tax=Blastococcus sp. CCUG 61487 TaxID=1840703 RepID=UPI0010BF7D7C|nr:hypothetical protein [Blastococcus sp. CCUG 61487]TKJ34587.1 hypothetical protein A6V29_15150 [Blastococcus sp. CCUG 61487]